MGLIKHKYYNEKNEIETFQADTPKSLNIYNELKLVKASTATNFTYILGGNPLTDEQIKNINEVSNFSEKFKLLSSLGGVLEFEMVDHPKFRVNLQTIDYYFGKMMGKMLLLYYANDISSENSVPKVVEKIALENFLNYDLKLSPTIYAMHMKKFLTDYALGMRAADIWERNYEATGGYLIVKSDGELICYHFYFAKEFENYLYNNTKFDTGDSRNDFGHIYSEGGILKMKLNLQIRFIK